MSTKLPRQISALESQLKAVSNKLENSTLDRDSDSESEEPMKEPAADNAFHPVLTRHKKKPKK
jgi:hypothetical protein